MSQVRKMLDHLEQSLFKNNWEHCSQMCFYLLYNKPSHEQIKLVCFTIKRYSPIFQLRWPAITWTEQILDNPEQWVARHGRAVPEDPNEVNPADAAYIFCFDALLNAVACRTDRTILTSSCVAAINSAINARATNVWIADDPEAVSLWETHSDLCERSLLENVAAIAVTEREWRIVMNWFLTQSKENLLEEVDLKEAEQGFARWQEREMSLMVSSLI